MKHKTNLVYGFGTSIQGEAVLLLNEMRLQKTTQEAGGVKSPDNLVAGEQG